MKKVLGITENISNQHYSKLYKIFISLKNNANFLHNFTDMENIPTYVKYFLSLGLKFCVPNIPHRKTIQKYFNEILRKLSWITYFKEKGEAKHLSNFDKFLINCKKNKNQPQLPCPLKLDIFPNRSINNHFYNLLLSKINSNPLFPESCMTNFRNFFIQNNFLVKNADKNAGICIMKKSDYNAEIFRQLNDTDTYFPTTKIHFDRSMEQFIDKTKSLHFKLTEQKSLESLIILNFKPASFYVLPKVHKPFKSFPIGRPISSTCRTINKNINALVDFILQPVMNFVPNLLLDTSHLILLLNELTLDPCNNYMIVTYDICSMYTNLNIQSSINHCICDFIKYQNVLSNPFTLSGKQLEQIMKLSLNYSYISHENEYFIQHKGIQMGNSAAVCVANISTYHELKEMFLGRSEIVFNARFLDDGLLIVNTHNIENIDDWCLELFQHEFLTFTYKYDLKKLEYLDVNIHITQDNIIETSLYQKPMSKHLYMHYKSNHPKHLLNSLPYSQGLRIIRICSKESDRRRELTTLYSKFSSRGYPKHVLNTCNNRIMNIERLEIIKPKKPMLISNLRIHNPHILTKYCIIPALNIFQPQIKIFIVMPFYENIFNLSLAVKKFILKEAEKGMNENYTRIISNLDLCISFKKINCLENFCK